MTTTGIITLVGIPEFVDTRSDDATIRLTLGVPYPHEAMVTVTYAGSQGIGDLWNAIAAAAHADPENEIAVDATLAEGRLTCAIGNVHAPRRPWTAEEFARSVMDSR